MCFQAYVCFHALRDLLSEKSQPIRKENCKVLHMLWHLLYVCCYVLCHYEESKCTFHIFLFHNILSVFIQVCFQTHLRRNRYMSILFFNLQKKKCCLLVDFFAVLVFHQQIVYILYIKTPLLTIS